MKHLCTMGILWFAPSLVGCWSSKATPIQCHIKCADDPTQSCIAEATCTDDADCWGGLACLYPPMATLDAGTSQPKTCRWKPHLEPDSLTRRFVSRTMDLEVTRSPTLGLSWMSPKNTWFIECAIFTCNPVTRPHADNTGNPSDEAPTGETMLWEIANADVCMFKHQVSDASRTKISLDSAAWQPPKPVCPAQRIEDRVIDFFAAGCLAYDSNQVIAASELVRIAAEDMASVVPSLSVGTRCERDTDPCDDTDHQVFGSCLDTYCAPRCVDDANCVEVAVDLLREPQETAKNWRCNVTIPNSPVRACRPPAGSSMTTELGPGTAAHGHPGP